MTVDALRMTCSVCGLVRAKRERKLELRLKSVIKRNKMYLKEDEEVALLAMVCCVAADDAVVIDRYREQHQQRKWRWMAHISYYVPHFARHDLSFLIKANIETKRNLFKHSLSTTHSIRATWYSVPMVPHAFRSWSLRQYKHSTRSSLASQRSRRKYLSTTVL